MPQLNKSKRIAASLPKGSHLPIVYDSGERIVRIYPSRAMKMVIEDTDSNKITTLRKLFWKFTNYPSTYHHIFHEGRRAWHALVDI
jgi:hypothetical protein